MEKVIECATGNTEEFFTKFLGKIKISDDWTFEEKTSRRFVAVASKTGLTFVAKQKDILVFRTGELIRAAQSAERKESAVKAPESDVLSTESDVTILSLSPKEAFLVVCQSEPEVQIYAIDTTRPLPARFKAKTSTPSPCVSVSWMDARTFVVLTDDNKAVEVDVDGHAKDWIVKEPLIALDVYHGDAAWVKASSPSILSIDGMNDVKLDRVQRFFPGKEEEMVISSIKIVEPGMLVVVVVTAANGERTSMGIGIVTWNATTKEVCIYPEIYEFYLSTDLESVDPHLSHSLCVEYLQKWNAWLVGCGEETSTPLKLILKDEDVVEFTSPEESFTWPLSEGGDDSVMFGMGIDDTTPLKLSSVNGTGEERTCCVVICASQNGQLIISALGKDMEDVASTASEGGMQRPSVHAGTTALSAESVLTEEEESEVAESVKSTGTASNLKQTPSSEPRQETPVKPDQKPTFEQPESSEQPEQSSSESMTEEESKEKAERQKEEMEALFTHRMIAKYNEDAAKHIQQFNSIRRLAEVSKQTKIRAIDLAWHGHQILQTLKENEIDDAVQQQMDFIHRLQNRILSVHQIIQNFQFVLKKEESEPEKVQWDVEDTISQLGKQKQMLEHFSSAQGCPASSRPMVEETVDQMLSEFQEAPEEDDSVEIMKEIIQWVNPPLMVTKLASAEKCEEEKMWKTVSDKDSYISIKDLPQTMELPDDPAQTFLLEKIEPHDEDAKSLYQWIPEKEVSVSSDDQTESFFTIESDSDKLELCTEEEIEQIIQAQAQREAEEAAKLHTAGLPMTEEQKKVEALFSRVLQGVSSRGTEPVTAFKLPTAPPVPSMQQFLKNLDQEAVQIIPTTEPPPVRRESSNMTENSASPEPAQPPSSVPSFSTSPAPVAASLPVQNQGVGSFQAGGFSGFGMPSQMGMMGVAPQLGSLGNAHPSGGGASGSGAIGGGFGAFAKGGNVFGAMAQGQSGQPLNAFAAMAQQSQPGSFGGMNAPGFNINSCQGNSKLFEMRK